MIQTCIFKCNEDDDTLDETSPLCRSNILTTDELSQSRHDVLFARSRPKGVRVYPNGSSAMDRELFSKANIRCILFPWMRASKMWWVVTSLAALCTIFVVPYQVAFRVDPGSLNGPMDLFDWLLTVIFSADVVVTFHSAFYRDEILIYHRLEIASEYVKGKIWLDLIGIFPFERIALAVMRDRKVDNLLLSPLQLLRFARLYRLHALSDLLQYNARVSLLWFTLARNIGLTLACTHFEACGMYFLARLDHFSRNTWLGPKVNGMSGFFRYITALYFNIVTFCTVGYGDFAPANAAERTLGSCFMLLNIVVAAWMIGSITLLIVKGDERTGEYRESLQTLYEYSTMHGFDESLSRKLQTQLRLEFNNREIADERVLKDFPSSLRRKILRKLYMKPLLQTQLMRGVRQQFVDAFLASCTVEIFSPGEEIVERESISSDLFLLVGGIAEVTNISDDISPIMDGDLTIDGVDENRYTYNHQCETVEAGDFIGEIGFFTESPQVESITCLTVCKTLTMPRSAYKQLAEDHPGSAGKILQNLLEKVEKKQLLLPRSLSVIRAGSVFDMESGYNINDINRSAEEAELKRQTQTLIAVKDLVQMHMSKQLDDQTTRLLFAASRGDTNTISIMCGQGFDPNSADYDQRTALMVASMKGNTDVVTLLLKYKVGFF